MATPPESDYERGWNDGKYAGRLEMWRWFIKLQFSALWLAGFRGEGVSPPWGDEPLGTPLRAMPSCNPESANSEICSRITSDRPSL